MGIQGIMHPGSSSRGALFQFRVFLIFSEGSLFLRYILQYFYHFRAESPYPSRKSIAFTILMPS